MRKAISMDPRGRKVVWPGKCYCIGVKIASMVEMFDESSPSTSKVSLAQGSDQSAPTFKESLLAASQAASGAGAAYQAQISAGRRQKPVAEDAKLPPTRPYLRAVPSPARSQQTAPQQVLMNQQPLLVNPLEAPGICVSASTVAAGQSMRDVREVRFSSLQSNLAQPAAAKSDGVPSSHVRQESDPPPAAAILPPVPQESPAATTLSNTVANVVPNTLVSAVPAPPANAVSNEDGSGVPKPAPSVPVDAVQIVVPNAGESDARNAVPSAVSSPVPSVGLSGVHELLPSAFPSVVPGTSARVVPGAISSAVPTTVPHTVAGIAGISASPVAPNAIPDASLHAAANPSARVEGVAAKSSTVGTSQADPPAAAPDQNGLATGLIVPETTTDQLVTLIQPEGGSLVAAQAKASSISPAALAKPSDMAVSNGKDGANNDINDGTGLKQHAPAASDQGGSPADSNGTVASGDQSQGSASQQGQSAAPPQMNFADHTMAVTDHAQNTGVAAPLQTVPTPAGASGHNAKTAETAPTPTVALPQAMPIINTAKLIQSMGQSEMRVGMRSNDFGNISISTSTTRDMISAQISLDHGELARTLATHLPEMQARWGGNQAMDVRIDINGQSTGQGTGTSPGASNGSAEGSRGGRQQQGGGGSSQSDGGFAGQVSAIAAAGLPPGEGDAHLDIRV